MVAMLVVSISPAFAAKFQRGNYACTSPGSTLTLIILDASKKQVKGAEKAGYTCSPYSGPLP
jgi:hypothetical protein